MQSYRLISYDIQCHTSIHITASPTNGGSSNTPSVGQPPLKPLGGRGVLLHEEVMEHRLEAVTNLLHRGGGERVCGERCYIIITQEHGLGNMDLLGHVTIATA